MNDWPNGNNPDYEYFIPILVDFKPASAAWRRALLPIPEGFPEPTSKEEWLVIVDYWEERGEVAQALYARKLAAGRLQLEHDAEENHTYIKGFGSQVVSTLR